MKRSYNIDIILVSLLAIISLFCILIPLLNNFKGASIFYILLMLLLPGYSLLIALYPERNKSAQKIIMGIPASMVFLVLFDLTSTYLKLPFKTLLLILAVTALFFSILGYIRRINDLKQPKSKYIICKNCEGYYKLKKGEFLKDFKVCQCGGELNYAKNGFLPNKSIDNPFNKKSTSKYIVCEKCNGYYTLKDGESLKDFKSCHCSGKLKYAEKNFKPVSIQEKSKSKKISKLNSKSSDLKKSKFIPFDILLTCLISILCIIFVSTPELESNILKTIFGLLLIVFISGYSLISIIYPKKDSLESVERFTLSFGSSIALTSVVGFILYYSQLEVQINSIFLIVSILTILLSFLVYIQRWKLHEDERFSLSFAYYFNRIIESFEKESWTGKILSIVLVISFILAVSATAYVIVVPKEGEKFTEFYILGSNGKASDYPTNLTVGDTGNVTVGIVNHEYSTVNYERIIKLNNKTIDDKNITLSNNEKYFEPFIFVPSNSGQNQKLEFSLYKLPDKNNAYRSLHLWINVH